uniref:Uncharacterized protein n=1 Tax=viral metagenome TaxID=1070528 RepID=A0A6C0B5C9_9ZZZZ
MSSAKKILTKLESISSKLDEVLNRLDKLEKKTINSKKNAPSSSPPTVKVGKVLITEYDKYILVTGDTFDIRNDFKVYRGKWDADSKGWKIMTSNIENYEDFKNDLQQKCSALKTTKGKLVKLKKPTSDSSSPGSDEGECMIMDSSDSESE